MRSAPRGSTWPRTCRAGSPARRCSWTPATTPWGSDRPATAAARVHRIGVVCDTHVADALPSLPPGVAAALGDVELVLHAGDLTSRGVLRELESLAPVVAVRGNHDRRAGLRLPAVAVVRVGGARIGLTHGEMPGPVEACWGALGVAAGRPLTPGLLRAVRRRTGAVDCAVFGHHHLPVLARVGGTLVFSPGAVYTAEADPAFGASGLRTRLYRRYRRGLPHWATRPAVGILEIRDGVVTPRVVPVEGPLRPPRGC